MKRRQGGLKKIRVGLFLTGVMLLDLEDPTRVIARAPDFILEPEEFYEIARTIRGAAARGETPSPRLLYTESELRETRKLQVIARVERAELGGEA